MSKIIPAPWNILEKDPHDRRFILIHNALTNNNFRLQKKLAGDPLGSGVNEDWRKFLLAQKLITPEELIPVYMQEKLDLLMNGFGGNKATATLLPTYDCQLACSYCYNAQLRDSETGQKKTPIPAKKMARKLLDYYEQTPAHFWKLSVTGGGEPFLATDYLSDVATLLKNAAERMGREFMMVINSNGQAMTKRRVNKLRKVGFQSVAITIDPEHDKTRPLKGGKGSLDTILKNLDNLPSSLALTIAVNIAPGQEKAFLRLLKKLEPLRQRIIKLAPAIVFAPFSESMPIEESKRGFSRNYNEKEIALCIFSLDAAEDAGFPVDMSFPRIGCESFMLAERMVINFAGEETFCAAVDSFPEYRVDTPGGAMAAKQYDHRVQNPQWKEFCYTDGSPCPYLTRCWGGCRQISVAEGAGWNTINCEFLHFDTMTRRLLRSWAD